MSRPSVWAKENGPAGREVISLTQGSYAARAAITRAQERAPL
jgi:hypothetical protein